MMNRKKLINKEKFVFNDAEIVAPLGNSVHSKRPSVQNRLFPKAETNKPTFKPPIPGAESPLTPGRTIQSSPFTLGRTIQSSPFTLGRNIQSSPFTPGRTIQSSPFTPGRTIQSSPFTPGPNILADWMKPRVNKECLTTDPCVEEVVAKLAKFNIESGSTKFPQAAPKSCSKEVFDPFQSYHKNMSFSSQNKNKVKKEKFVNYQNGNRTEKNQALPFRKSAAVSRPISPLTPPYSPDDEAVKEKEDNVDSCICMRPLKLILCPVCSHTTTGRIRKICQAHPKALFLLDIEACHICKETKFVLKEYELPDGFIPVVNNLVT